MSETQLHIPLTPLLRVPVPCTDEPLEIEDKSENNDNDYTNIKFMERTQAKAPLSLPLPIHEGCSNQYNLRPPKPRNIAALCKQVTPSNHTIGISKDL